MDKQKQLIHLYSMKEHWEQRVIAKERTISTFSDFFTDEELNNEYNKLEVYRDYLDSVKEEIKALISSNTDIEK